MDELRGLYAITDPGLTPGQTLIDASAAALRGGAKILQYRDKNATDEERLYRATRLRQLCHEHRALFIINDDPRLAAACGADGVHLGQQDGGIALARDLLGARAIIGISCHGDLALAHQAQQQGASYVALGRFFASRTKPQAPPASLDTLIAARHELRLPVVAIGGIRPDNAGQLIDAGADAVAVIHGLFASKDIEARARQLSALFRPR